LIYLTRFYPLELSCVELMRLNDQLENYTTEYSFCEQFSTLDILKKNLI